MSVMIDERKTAHESCFFCAEKNFFLGSTFLKTIKSTRKQQVFVFAIEAFVFEKFRRRYTYIPNHLGTGRQTTFLRRREDVNKKKE